MASITEQDVMKNFTKCLSGSVLTGIAKIDEAIKKSTKFNSLQDVVDKMVADCRNAGSAEVFLRDYCGITNQNVPKENFPLTYIDPETGDTVEYRDSTHWGVYLYPKEDGTSTNYQDLLPQNGGIKVANETTFNRYGLNVHMPNFESLTNEEKLALNGVYSWWIEDAVKLVEDTYSVDFDGQSIDVDFDNKGDAGATTNLIDANGKILDRPEMVVHKQSWNYTDLAEYAIPTYGADNIASKALKVYGPYNITSVIAHEITHVAQFYFNLPVFDKIDNSPTYIYEGMADLTVGRFNSDDINELAGDADLLATYLNIENPSTEDKKHYEAGFMFWHYLMKQTADSYDGVTDYSKPEFVGTNNADTGHAGYVKFGSGSNYSLGGGDDTLNIHGDNILADGGGDNDYISNSGANVTINGGTGNDTIYMGEHWNNVFIYKVGDGNDTLYNFHEQDELKISGASHSTISSENDVIVNVGDGQILLKDANGKNLKISNDTATPTAPVTPDPVTPYPVTPDPVVPDPVAPDPVTPNPIAQKENVLRIVASTGSDEVIGGNDEQVNEFVYTSGNVIINNYNSWENIYVSGTPTGWNIEGNDFILNTTDGSLRVTEARDKMIEFKDFNENILTHVCVHKNGDTFDGSTFHEPIIAIGADKERSILISGNGGSNLWGGTGKTSNDDLIGGEGVDVFKYNLGNGNDAIIGAESQDIVDLSSITMNDIRGIKFREFGSLFVFNDFGSLSIFGKPDTFIIGSENVYKADYENSTLIKIES